MKNVILFILLMAFEVNSSAQNWTEPVDVSNMTGANHSPDITMDNNGILHCIWEHRASEYYSEIHYSLSEDNGLTWCESSLIPYNDSVVIGKLNIISDSDNKLYITYDFDVLHYLEEMVYMKIFNGVQWSEPILLSENIPASYNSTLVIDNNDRIYCFWFNWCGNTFYRYYEDNTFSEIFIPYSGSGHFLFFSQEVIDNFNNIHVVGTYHSEEQSLIDNHVIYCKYFYDSNTWTEIIDISSPTTGSKSIALDNYNYPHIAWRQETPMSGNPDTTLYRYFDGIGWSDPQFVVEDPKYQRIVVDVNNTPHITNREKYNSGFQLVHYYLYDNNWIGTIIDTANYSIRYPKLYIFNNKLYTIYCKMDIAGGDGHVMFAQADIVTNMQEKSHIPFSSEIKVYPNPFKLSTKIEYEIYSPSKVNIKILDMNGGLVKTLLCECKDRGRYRVKWNGKDKNGNQVINGIYLCRLQFGKHIITKSIVLLR
jgi:hypothetical protein